MPQTQVLPLVPTWSVPESAPSWLTQALSADVDPWSGAYSFVYPLGATQVVKLVDEPGCLEYLRMCRASRGIAHLPQVFEGVFRRELGMPYTAVRMERLSSGGSALERYSEAYVQEVRRTLVEAPDTLSDAPSNAERSALALSRMAAALRRPERSLSSCLMLLAEQALEHGWALDLGREDNWMLREGGTVVLSDPAHSESHFPDDLV